MAEARDECQELNTKLDDTLKELTCLKEENAKYAQELQKKEGKDCNEDHNYRELSIFSIFNGKKINSYLLNASLKDMIDELISKKSTDDNEMTHLTEEIQALKETVKSLQDQIETLESQMKAAVEEKEQEIQSLKQVNGN